MKNLQSLNIAVIGAGIAGLTSAYYLNRHHQVTLFESSSKIGGHTATVDIEHLGCQYAIDTGFIVYNDWTYPNFIRLMDEIGVDSKPTAMSFSVRCDNTNLEYAGSSISALFAQRRNIFRPRFWLLIRDILRFNREAVADLDSGSLEAEMKLGEYLDQKGYSDSFVEHYLVPMGAAIWSSGTAAMRDFPLLFFVRFFKQHGLLSVKNRPQWRVIQGGSSAYLSPLTASFASNIVTEANIVSVERSSKGVELHFGDGHKALFDQVVIATHSDQALSLLKQATDDEQTILSAIPYQDNDVVLHSDKSLLPKRELAWSSWNYRLSSTLTANASSQQSASTAKLTYNMNILQGIESDTTFCVSLNQSDDIDPSKVIYRTSYSHPVFTLEGIQAQSRWASLAGENNTWYCGAYWRNGFHEDGVVSALRVVDGINRRAGVTTEPLYDESLE